MKMYLKCQSSNDWFSSLFNCDKVLNEVFCDNVVYSINTEIVLLVSMVTKSYI